MERGSSAVERRTHNPGFESHLLLFRSLAIFVLPRCPSSFSCINEYLAENAGGNVSE